DLVVVVRSMCQALHVRVIPVIRETASVKAFEHITRRIHSPYAAVAGGDNNDLADAEGIRHSTGKPRSSVVNRIRCYLRPVERFHDLQPQEEKTDQRVR